ncbi:hypothetical protein RKD48_007008 [Streptomyces ambofaciens]
MRVAGRVHRLGEPFRIVVRADHGRARLGEPQQRGPSGGSARPGHRDHRAVERPVPHGPRLPSLLPCRLFLPTGAVAHAAARSAPSAAAVIPRVEAITFLSFLDRAS